MRFSANLVHHHGLIDNGLDIDGWKGVSKCLSSSSLYVITFLWLHMHGGKLLVDILPNPWGYNLLSHYHNRDHQVHVYQEHRFNSHAIMAILFIRYIGGTFKDNSMQSDLKGIKKRV